jgi:hypothetical protein
MHIRETPHMMKSYAPRDFLTHRVEKSGAAVLDANVCARFADTRASS